MGSLHSPFPSASSSRLIPPPLGPVRRPSSSQAAQLAGSWGLGGETRHLQVASDIPRAARLRLPDVASRGLQVARSAHECAYMPHRYFICTCKTNTIQPGVSGDGGRWAGGRRGFLIKMNSLTRSSERVAVPRTFAPSLSGSVAGSATGSKMGPCKLGMVRPTPPLQAFNNHMAFMRGAARSEGRKISAREPPTRTTSLQYLLPLTGFLPLLSAE